MIERVILTDLPASLVVPYRHCFISLCYRDSTGGRVQTVGPLPWLAGLGQHALPHETPKTAAAEGKNAG